MRPVLVLLSSFLLLSTGCTASSRVADAAGSGAPGPVSIPEGPALRVMTFNIQSARHGLDRVAEVIRASEPDIVAMQEVDRATRRSQGLDQAKELSGRAGLEHHAYFRAADLHGGEYGLAVLSRFPIVSARHYELPTPVGLETRAVAHVVLEMDGREISVYVTHLSNLPRRSDLRVAQAQFIGRLMQRDPRPRLLMGDLNDAPDSAALLLLKRGMADAFDQRGQGSDITYPLPLFLPDLRLDYVLSSPEFTARGARVVRELASDHYPVIADFAVPRRPIARTDR